MPSCYEQDDAAPAIGANDGHLIAWQAALMSSVGDAPARGQTSGKLCYAKTNNVVVS